MAWHSGKNNKYGNRKVVLDGRNFDSVAEAERYVTLKLMCRKGEISNLKMQVRYELIPAQKKRDKRTERSCSYIADFVYTDLNGITHVEDVKGKCTPEYVIKRKLMLWVYGIEIEEIGCNEKIRLQRMR